VCNKSVRSGLDELTREELIALLLKLHKTVQSQERQIAKLKASIDAQSKHIREKTSLQTAARVLQNSGAV